MNYVDCTYNIADKFLWGGLFNYINAYYYIAAKQARFSFNDPASARCPRHIHSVFNLIVDILWTSMLCSIDSCQKGIQ